MKKILFLLLTVFIISDTIAQPPAGSADKGMVFGQTIDSTAAIAINNLPGVVKEPGTAVKVRGRVAEVCVMEGCWLKMQTADGKIMVKMKDHSFLVPVAINGKEIVVEGFAVSKVTPVAELKHYAEDAGKSKEEIAAIQQPKHEIVLNAIGILVL
jgi:hypothetical protein